MDEFLSDELEVEEFEGEEDELDYEEDEPLQWGDEFEELEKQRSGQWDVYQGMIV